MRISLGDRKQLETVCIQILDLLFSGWVFCRMVAATVATSCTY